jgi:manganese/zinc/iron transport system permease protein
MAFVSFTTVASFESVGAILVVAFLIAPPATAYLLTKNLKKMIFLACIVGILSAIGGHFLAISINGSIAGAMATVAGLIFAIAFIFTRIKSKSASKITSMESIST